MFNFQQLTNWCLATVLLLAVNHALAEVRVDKAWVRASTATNSAAYMHITSTQAVNLISASSPVAKAVEIHQMSMSQGVMKMRQIDTLTVSPKQPSELAPGGLHLMLLSLKKPLNIGDKVSLLLGFEDAQQRRFIVKVQAPVKDAP